ncbi:MAG: DnaJ domain-containing protein [Pseudomonadota bacterium]
MPCQEPNRDCYRTLGVTCDAPPEAVKRAFRTLARELHPDRNPGSKEAEERFKGIVEAYAILSDPTTRFEYDRGRLLESPCSRLAALGDDLAAAALALADGLAKAFDGFASAVRRKLRVAANGRHLRCSLELGSVEAALGGTRTIVFPVLGLCDACGGGTGGGGRSCPRCAGTGRLIVERELTIRIPPGTRNGEVRRVSAEGEPGTNGGCPGDLFVVFRVVAGR